ncbi:hypothetical protein PIB30_108446 [Stylosanthes scabra]|uniref:Uncharacterized protein n=1 Tax=Stylosanthes scabra TaxID=79078 RepID=A0ABU6YYW3_9FABA|nr:hypothetical protein [Stylosanthes scabra]
MKKMECGNLASEVRKLHAYAWKTARTHAYAWHTTQWPFPEFRVPRICVDIDAKIEAKKMKKQNWKQNRAEVPRICVEEHAYACYIKSSPCLSNSVTLRRGNQAHPQHA